MPEAVIPVVAEGAVGAGMTAAEIAAAEAAQVAAAEAATQAAVQQAATQVAAEQATQAAAQAAAEQTTAQSGIQQLLQPTTAPTNIPAQVQTAPLPSATTPSAPQQIPTIPNTPAPLTPLPTEETLLRSQGPIDTTPRMATPGFDTAGFESPDGITTLAREVGAQTPNMQGVQTAVSEANLPSVANAPVPIEQDPYNFFNNPKVNPESSSFVGPRPEDTLDQQFRQAGITSAPNVSTANPLYQLEKAPTPYAQGINPTGAARLDAPLRVSGDPFYNINSSYVDQLGVRPGYGLTDVAVQPSALTANAPTPPAGGLQGLWNDFKAMPLKDKLLTGMMGASAYQMLNQPKPYEPKKYKSTWNAKAYSGYQPVQPTPYTPQYAGGGLADLGGYSDGGRMLKGPGDGMSDDIPATIANKQPARLANEEFVIPADVVSHLGNGSSEAGAKQLYKMMDRVRQARTGTKKQGKQIKPEKYLA